MTTVDALKQLYVAKGGDAATVANLVTIPDMIMAFVELETASKASPAKASRAKATTAEKE